MHFIWAHLGKISGHQGLVLWGGHKTAASCALQPQRGQLAQKLGILPAGGQVAQYILEWLIRALADPAVVDGGLFVIPKVQVKQLRGVKVDQRKQLLVRMAKARGEHLEKLGHHALAHRGHMDAVACEKEPGHSTLISSSVVAGQIRGSSPGLVVDDARGELGPILGPHPSKSEAALPGDRLNAYVTPSKVA